MQRFHFHVLPDSGTLIRDEEGEVRSSAGHALAEAREIARELVGHEILKGLDPFAGSPVVIVEDEGGREVGRVSFRDALSISRPRVEAG